MVGNYYFVIVGHHDNPVFESEFTTPNKPNETKVRIMLNVFQEAFFALVMIAA